MNDLEHFREYTDRVLSGLSADDALRQKILEKAVRAEEKPVPRFSLRPVLMLGSLVCVLLLGVVLLNGLRPLPTSSEPGGINVFAAGQSIPDGPGADVLPLTESEAAAVVSVEWVGKGEILDVSVCRSLARTLISDSVPAEATDRAVTGKLILRLENGNVIQFAAEEPFLQSGSCWSCQPFFDLLKKTLP